MLSSCSVLGKSDPCLLWPSTRASKLSSQPVYPLPLACGGGSVGATGAVSGDDEDEDEEDEEDEDDDEGDEVEEPPACRVSVLTTRVTAVPRVVSPPPSCSTV